MESRVSLEIHFYGEEEVSVLLGTQGDLDKQYGEILMFCLFSLRQMFNLGNNQLGNSLASLLSECHGHVKELAYHKSPDAPEIIDYDGLQGSKRFLATLDYFDGNSNFKMKAKGFGLLARGMGYFAPTSVATLLRYLSRIHIDDPCYLDRLSEAAATCGDAFLGGEVTLANQTKTALNIIHKVFGDAKESSALEEDDECEQGNGKEEKELRDEDTKDIASEKESAGRSPSEPIAVIDELVRKAGQGLTADDVRKRLQETGARKGRHIDDTTLMVLESRVPVQCDILRANFRAISRLGEETVKASVRSVLFAGYLIARCLLNTHKIPSFRSGFTYTYSSMLNETAEAAGLLFGIESVKPFNLLEESGEEVGAVILETAANMTGMGVYARIRREAQELLLITLLEGFSLGILEFINAAKLSGIPPLFLLDMFARNTEESHEDDEELFGEDVDDEDDDEDEER
jgi:hypothetical protein